MAKPPVHSRQNKNSCLESSELSWNTILNMHVDERSAKSGEMIPGCRQEARFPPKPNYYFLAHAYANVPWNLHANSLCGIWINIKSTNQQARNMR